MIEYLYLLNTEYENEKSRIILHFSKNPLSSNDDFIIKEKFYPYFITDVPKKLLKSLLSDFKNKISIKENISKGKNKLIARDYEVLRKCFKIITTSTTKNLLLIEPEREYLIENNWSYYDAFCLFENSKIKKIKNYNLIHSAIKEYIHTLTPNQPDKLVRSLSKKLLLTNILKVKPDLNIKSDQILNVLFENYFFKKELLLKDKSRNKFEKKEKTIKNTTEINFSNIWPYLLLDKHYNIGYETINCECCKPKKIFEENTLSCSLVEAKFLKDGIYFLSKDKDWAKEYHKNNPNKENRNNYRYKNGLKNIPTGPFYKNQKELIPLSDSIQLLENKKIKLTNTNNKLIWHCKKKESFISEIVKDIDRRLKNIEQSINLSTYLNYSKNYINSNNLEKSPNFIQYMTEYILLNNILEEIPKFILHQNTKFYDPLIANALRSIKQDTYIKANPDSLRLIEQKEKIFVYDKKLVNNINNLFIKLNLPIPKLISTS